MSTHNCCFCQHPELEPQDVTQEQAEKMNDDDIKRTKSMQLRESLVERLSEVAPDDDWEDSDPIEKLHALLRKKLGRKTFAGERKFSQTFYKTIELTPRGSRSTDVTIAARYDFRKKCWDAGFAWRNPLDKPAPNLAKKIARKKLGQREFLWYEQPYGQPPWWNIVRDEFLTYNIDHENVDNVSLPRWLGNEIQRFETLVDVWYELRNNALKMSEDE